MIISVTQHHTCNSAVVSHWEYSPDRQTADDWPQDDQPIGDATFEPSRPNFRTAQNFDQSAPPDDKTLTYSLHSVQTGRYNAVPERPLKQSKFSYFEIFLGTKSFSDLPENSYACHLRGVLITHYYCLGGGGLTDTWRTLIGCWEAPPRHFAIGHWADCPGSIPQ